MKIAVSSEGKNITDPVDARFGRCSGFIIYDTDQASVSYIENNQNTEAVQGAGIQAAKSVADTGAGILITGNIGPKAYKTLDSAGVKVYLCAACSVKEAIEKLEMGELKMATSANAQGHW